MTTRREFLQGALAASGVALSTSAFGSPLSALAGGKLPMHTAVFEPEFAASARFGAAAGRLGLRTFALDGSDITPLWTDQLMALWRRQPAAVAGLTTHMPLFLLERFGWDHGLRVVFRAEHRAAGSLAVQHRLDGPVPMLSAFQALAARHDYGSCLASVMSGCPTHAAGSSQIAMTTPTTAVSDTPLYSWVIAPRSVLTAA
jgi:hypothetical protein